MTPEFSHEVKIPHERVAVLIGKDGDIKKRLEEKTQTKLDIDSENGDVLIQGDDGLNIFDAKEVVVAIGRGFNPEIALNLVDDNNQLEIIDITTYTGDSKKKLIRIRARVIGEGGKTREYIEKLTDTNIVIYGKTVGIIGNYEVVGLVRRAFEGLLSGQRHSTVYTWLEKNVKERKQYI